MDGGAVISATRRGCAVGQSTIDDQCSGAVDVGNGNQGLVQCRVAPVANKVVQILLIGILVAPAGTVLLAQTGNREALVRSIGVGLIDIRLVVKPVRVSGIVSRGSLKGICKETYEK